MIMRALVSEWKLVLRLGAKIQRRDICAYTRARERLLLSRSKVRE